ncbi:MAG: AMP-binding protein [Leptospirales bacterium]|nr:AMP-binding protein [Leptospirales bacterium]
MSHEHLRVGNLVKINAEKHPEKEALLNSNGSIRYSYKELSIIIDNFAKALIRGGVKKGDKVAIWAVNCIEWVIAQIGISRAGAVVVTVNPHEKPQIIEHMISYSDTVAIVMREGVHKTENIDMLYNELCPELKSSEKDNLNLKKFPKLKSVIMAGTDKSYDGLWKWEEVMEVGSKCSDDDLNLRLEDIGWDDIAHMIFTSGTTGLPKGVPLSNKNLISNAIGMTEKMAVTADDKICLQPPLFHTFGCVACVVVGFMNGSSIMVMEKFQPEVTLKMIEQERSTILSGVPTMFHGFLKAYESGTFDTSSLRTGIIAGAASPKGLIDSIITKMQISGLIQAYGLTECSPCITASSHGDSIEQKENTVGRLIPRTQIKLVDENTGLEVGHGKVGEICVMGDSVMEGYYKMPEETVKTINSDGWLHTGDVGYIREDGCLTLTSRIKDIIIRGGENIYPAEIEHTINDHEAVEESYAVGVPDHIKGEEIMAFIKTKPGETVTEEELKAFCKNRIASHKVPKYMVFTEEFPVSATGKVLKRELREIGAKKLKA